MNKTELFYIVGGALAIVGYGLLANDAAYISTPAFARGVIAGIPVGMLFLTGMQSIANLVNTITRMVDELTASIVKDIYDTEDR